MTTYVYETIPQREGVAPRRFEVRQRMVEDPLTHHPETGEPVRRVILGGFGFIASRRDSAPEACGEGACEAPSATGCCCQGACSHR
jgi:predicted nucleic acid-binding Zn ribbon protein